MALWDTAGNIVNDAATELGLQSFQAKSADPFGSTDPNLGRLCQLLKSVGRDLQRKRGWTHLQNVCVLETVENQAQYALPIDFGSMTNQTGWNRTNRMPLGGPLSPQEWQYLAGQLAGIVFTVLFRPMHGQLLLYPDTSTPGGYTLAYEYASRWWVQSSTVNAYGATQWLPSTTYSGSAYVTNQGRVYLLASDGTSGTVGPTGTGTGIADGTAQWDYVAASGADNPTASTDVVLFDPQLVMRALKLAYLRSVGMDSTAAEEDFNDAWAQATAEDTPARVLDLGQPKLLRVPLIGEQNIPITNFGT